MVISCTLYKWVISHTLYNNTTFIYLCVHCEVRSHTLFLRVANINALPLAVLMCCTPLHSLWMCCTPLHPLWRFCMGFYMVLIVTFATSAHIAILHTSAKGLQERKETTSPPKTKLTKYILILIILHPYYIPLGFRF